MVETPSRRDFLNPKKWAEKAIPLAFPAAAVGSAVYTVVHSSRVFEPGYEFTPAASISLERLSRQIAPKIIFRGYENIPPVTVQGISYKLEPRPEGFADMLLFMAFHEGGESAMERAASAIEERGVRVDYATPEYPVAEGEFHNPHHFLNTNKGPLQITLKPEAEVRIIEHEAYHLNQALRGDAVNENIKSVLAATGLTVGFYKFLEYIHPGDTKIMSRRSMLLFGLSWVASFGIIMPVLSPTELQPRLQLASKLPNALLSHPKFRDIIQKLFYYD